MKYDEKFTQVEMNQIAEIYLSNEKRAPGCLGYIGDQKLPSYMGCYNKPL